MKKLSILLILVLMVTLFSCVSIRRKPAGSMDDPLELYATGDDSHTSQQLRKSHKEMITLRDEYHEANNELIKDKEEFQKLQEKKKEEFERRTEEIKEMFYKYEEKADEVDALQKQLDPNFFK